VAAKEKEVKTAELKASPPKPSRHVCNVCGKTSDKRICDKCAMRIHLEALARKTHEEKGNAWTKWKSSDVERKHHPG
jgi:hypothetical protein